jgi:hypothetical protein
MGDVTPDTTEGANAGQWEIADDHCQQYLNDCRLATSDPLAFARFRRLPGITRVIETRQWKSVKEIMRHMAELSPLLYEPLRKIAIKNDSVGRGHIYSTRILPTATSAWYARDVAIIHWLFADHMPRTIIEIGGGYGGFAAIMSQAFQIERYAILDIKESSLLQSMFLKARGIDGAAVELIQDPPGGDPFDLVFASCSLSELNEQTANEYADKVLSVASMGYIPWSWPTDMKTQWVQTHMEAREWLQSKVSAPVHILAETAEFPLSTELLCAFYWDNHDS